MKTENIKTPNELLIKATEAYHDLDAEVLDELTKVANNWIQNDVALKAQLGVINALKKAIGDRNDLLMEC